MATTTLTAGNDTVYLYEGLLGGINSQTATLDLLGATLDGSTGSDTLVVDDNYPSSHFTITTATNGITTLSTASGSVSLQNFEKIQFKNTSLTLGTPVSTTPTAGNDSLTGTASADNLAALAGNDTITGLDGNDTLDGGTGIDSLSGGLGNDTYVIDTTADTITEAASAGTDLVRVAIATAGGTYTLGANIENATLTNTVAYNLTGNSLANTLTGNSLANVLNGGAGNDKLIGGLGNDTYVIDTTADTITEAASAGTDLVRVAVATAGGTYTLGANIENATLTNTVAYNLTGNSLANTLTGNSLANVLNGGDGNDRLAGGLGNDILTGGLGSDSFLFNSLPNSTSNRDTIADYDAGGMTDRILLDDAVFTALGIIGTAAGVALGSTASNTSKFCLGTQAAGAEDRIIYDQASGKLFYDPTGSVNGATDSIQIALVGTTTHPILNASDIFIV